MENVEDGSSKMAEASVSGRVVWPLLLCAISKRISVDRPVTRHLQNLRLEVWSFFGH